MNVKISDFGTSKRIIESVSISRTRDPIGETRFTAPEYLDAKRMSERYEKGDVYSFGIILWEIVTQEIPWGNKLPRQILQEVIKGGRLPIPPTLPKFQEIMQRCWKDGKYF